MKDTTKETTDLYIRACQLLIAAARDRFATDMAHGAMTGHIDSRQSRYNRAAQLIMGDDCDLTDEERRLIASFILPVVNGQ